MKVNLTYQVEFEEVPDEINRFVSKASAKANHLNLKMAELNYIPGRGHEFLTTLAEIKLLLHEVHEELETSSSIAVGFERAVLDQAVKQEESEALLEEEQAEETDEDEQS